MSRKTDDAVQAIDVAVEAFTRELTRAEAVEVWHETKQALDDRIAAALDDDPSLAEVRPGPGGNLVT
jgi:hypothetical protein